MLQSEISIPSDEEMLESIRAKLKAFVDELLGGSASVPHVEIVKSCHSVATGICEHARDHGIDLLTLGTRGRTGLNVLLLGTCAEKVIHSASCSTLAVKPEDFKYELT